MPFIQTNVGRNEQTNKQPNKQINIHKALTLKSPRAMVLCLYSGFLCDQNSGQIYPSSFPFFSRCTSVDIIFFQTHAGWCHVLAQVSISNVKRGRALSRPLPRTGDVRFSIDSSVFNLSLISSRHWKLPFSWKKKAAFSLLGGRAVVFQLGLKRRGEKNRERRREKGTEWQREGGTREIGQKDKAF